MDNELETVLSTHTDSTEILGHIHRLSQLVAKCDHAGVLAGALTIPLACLGVDASVILQNSTPTHLAPTAHRGVSPRFLSKIGILAESDIIAWLHIHQSPRVVDDTFLLPAGLRDLFLGEGARSLAFIPVIDGPVLSAVLLFMRKERIAFSETEINTLCTLANFLVSAARSDTETMAHHVGRTINSVAIVSRRMNEMQFEGNSIRTILDTAAGAVLDALKADSGSILLSEEGGYRVAAERNLPPGISNRLLTHNAGVVAARVIAARNPVTLHGGINAAEFPGAVPRNEIVSSLLVPLRGKNRIIGLMTANSTNPERVFTEEDMAAASAMAYHVAMAIESAKLAEATKAQAYYLGNLYRISRSMTSSLDIESVLDTIMDKLSALEAADICGLMLYDQRAKQATYTRGRGLGDAAPGEYADFIYSTVKLSRSYKHVVQIADLTAHPIYMHSHIPRLLGLRSGVVIPLLIKHEPIGYLAVFSKDNDALTKFVLRLLFGLAQIAAVAIENANLYDEQSKIASVTKKQLAPGCLPDIPGFDTGYKYVPAYQVGGDYYDIIPISDNRFGIAVADVSGKGVGAATHIAMCKHSLRALAPHIESPAALLAELNRLVYSHIEPEAFISMFYAVLDAKTGSMTYSMAGHEPAFLLTRESTRIQRLHTKGILLGVLPDATFTERNASILIDDILLLYTDGLIDSLSSEETNGIDVVKNALINLRLKSAGDIADNLYRLTTTATVCRPSDDVAVMVLKRSER